MSQIAELRCSCGTVTGEVTDAAPHAVSRVVCYCDDCQAFMHQLGRAELLDDHGGTEVIMIAPAALTLQRGQEHIACLRLSPKGVYRWYARCCATPLGNTLSPAGIPFVTIVGHALPVATEQGRDERFGKILGAVRGEFAIGAPPAGSTSFNARLVARTLGKMIGWKVRGRTWPHPFFERQTGEPRYPIQTLSRAERDALRPLCGPRPSAGATAQAS